MANPVKANVASNTPPSTARVVDEQGQITPEWLRYFQDIAGFIAYQSVWENVTPAGATQATAPELSTRNVYLLTAGAAGVRLPRVPFESQRVLIVNGSGNAQNIYPGVGGQIDAVGVNVPVSVASGATQEFISPNPVQWLRV